MKSKYLNLKNKFKIVLLFVFCIFLVTSIADVIVANDIEHILNCHDDNCQKCVLIQNAVNFVLNLNNNIKIFNIQNIIIPLSYVLIIKFLNLVKDTPVILNVRLDE